MELFGALFFRSERNVSLGTDFRLIELSLTAWFVYRIINHMSGNRRHSKHNRYNRYNRRSITKYGREFNVRSSSGTARLLSKTLVLVAIIAIGLIVFLAIHGIPDNLGSLLGPNSIEKSDGSLEPENLTDTSIKKSIPAYSDSPYVVLNNNEPDFSRSEISTKAYERLGDLDRFGRCTGALACLGAEIMPSESQERGSISEIHPTGWQSVQYKSVSGGSLYNRCHLIGWQLTGNDAVDRNLITGTRYMNEDGMEPFECRVAEYLRRSRTGNHVMYRVTPVFKGRELVARGVHMEAWSVEDEGAGISFNVYCYNVQPNIIINYKNGDNESTIEDDRITDSSGWNSSSKVKRKSNSSGTFDSSSANGSSNASDTSGTLSGKNSSTTYVLNTNTMKFHYPSCESVQDMSSRNRENTTKSRSELISDGYEPCGRCRP